jgi:hypothetical protein
MMVRTLARMTIAVGAVGTKKKPSVTKLVRFSERPKIEEILETIEDQNQANLQRANLITHECIVLVMNSFNPATLAEANIP